MSTLHVHTANDRRSITIDDAQLSLPLTDVLRRADLPLNTRCGQRGLCDGCRIELLSGTLISTDTGEATDASEASDLLRACQYSMVRDGHAEIHVPSRTLLGHAPQVVTDFCANVSRAHDPLWQCTDVPLDEIDPAMPFSEAICRTVSRERDGDLPVRPHRGVDALAESREASLRVALEHCGDHWLVHPAGAERPAFGVAIDVGTTTVVATLVDLASGEVIGTASALNAQARLGDNVLTRIQHCQNDKGMIDRLQHAVTKRTIRLLLDQVLREAALPADHIVCLAVAGNTTMLHLLAGVDPSPLGTAPFTPEFLEHRVLRSSGLSLLQSQTSTSIASGDLAPELNAAVHLLPGAAAYVGADIIAGVFSTGMIYEVETSMLVDLGTNGEIVLKHENRLLGCATAAGPAFEGAGLACGVRAGRGAIGHVRLNEDTLQPEIDVIGKGQPIGLCGTAYVDFVAEARLRGIVKKAGRFSGDSPSGLLARHPTHGQSFTVARGRGDEPIVVSEADIASLLQAKAAIAAGIVCLLHRAGLSAGDVETLYLAGGFGFHMDIRNVIQCGLLPGFRPEQVRLVGNTSLAGAYLALLDSGVLAEMKRAGKRLEIIELNLEPDFESQYIDQLYLPAV